MRTFLTVLGFIFSLFCVLVTGAFLNDKINDLDDSVSEYMMNDMNSKVRRRDGSRSICTD